MTYGIKKTALTGILGLCLLFSEKSAAQDKDTLTDIQKTQFDLKYLFRAMGEFPQSANGARNSYSRELDSLHALFKPLRNKNLYSNHGIVDPIVMDVCLALGFTGKFGVTMISDADGLNTAQNVIDATGDYMTGKYKSKYGDKTTTTRPSVMYNELLKGPQVALIVPSDFAAPIRIDGLGYKKTRDFINLHEAFHTVDSHFVFGDMDLSVADDFHFDFFNSLHGEKAPLALYAIINRRETFADVAAIGQMIRNGDGMEILDAVRDWRRGMPHNVKHMSVQTLDAFEKYLNKTGIDSFRRLDDAQARTVYVRLIKKHGQSVKSLNASLDMTEGKLFRRAGLTIKSLFGHEIRKGIGFARLRQGKEAPDDLKQPLSAAQISAETYLETWDALKELKDRAFRDDSLLTPQTLIRAYGKMQEEFSTKADGDNCAYELYTAKMIRLRKVFIENLANLDYAVLNMQRGISKQKIITLSQDNPP